MIRRCALGLLVALGALAQASVGIASAIAQVTPAPAAAPPPPVYGAPPTAWAAPPAVAAPVREPGEAELDLIESTIAVDVAVLVGGAQDASSDGAMTALGYVTDEQIVAADVGLVVRTVPWLWLGARTGFRVRTWERGSGPSAGAVGNDLLGVVEARFRFGRTFDFVLIGGVGLGHVVWQIENGVTSGVAPRVQGAGQLGVSLVQGLRMFVRLAWDYFQWSNTDDTDLDVDLGGFSAGGGIEVRL